VASRRAPLSELKDRDLTPQPPPRLPNTGSDADAGPASDPFADLFTSEQDAVPPPTGRNGRRGGGGTRPGRRPHPKWPYAVAVLLLLVGGGVAFVFGNVVPAVQGIFAPEAEAEDYTGAGEGEVLVVVSSGDTGTSIAEMLEAEGVVKSSAAFYEAVVAQSPEPVFQPGTYSVAKKMSAAAALERMLDPASRVQDTVVIPEGTTVAGILALIAESTEIPPADLEAAAADFRSYGLPAEAPSLEGYLFPATYQFEPGTTARDAIQLLVNRQFQALDGAGVAAADRHRVLTLASVIQREARYEEDFYKVSRVFLNRLEIGMPLQSDATVAYGVGLTGRTSTTDAERADPNPYNTYVHPGLPVGPIASPGDLAIKAALAPADGPWLYFVTVNTLTGETKFSETLGQHEAAVEEWKRFMRDNPGNE
jgi:UPF0755 protein